MILYGHWPEKALEFTKSLGIKGRWVNVDMIGEPWYAAEVLEAAKDPEWRFILHIEWIEARLRGTDGAWEAMRIPIQWLRDVGLADRVDAIQISDEFWSRLAHFGLPIYHDGWPSMRGWSAERCWAARHEFAVLFGQRAEELRNYWREIVGPYCPMIGTAETGGVVPPTFPGQEWWGLNIYLQGAGNPDHNRRVIQNIYKQAWNFTNLPIQPVIPTYGDLGHMPASLTDLALTYAVPFDGYPAIIDHPQTWSVAVFCVHHPTIYDPRHGQGGLGLSNLPPHYSDGVRWLANYLRTR